MPKVVMSLSCSFEQATFLVAGYFKQHLQEPFKGDSSTLTTWVNKLLTLLPVLSQLREG